MNTFTINKIIGPITLHGLREDGLPETAEWRGQLYDTPELETLEFWTWDSVVETLEGGRIEPDGFDHTGCPSWLLVLGLV
jgi:metal-dependent amidase/aminoacylase/carboxypeptidase family protein|tara:strand:- start:164 stop:403 length:240 start_codon:yes stop_codon:yes gene_type:complete